MSNIVAFSHGLRIAAKAMSKTARGCGHVPKQHPAILPWLSSLLWPELPKSPAGARQHARGRVRNGGCDLQRHPPTKRGMSRATPTSAANAELLDQALVAAFIGTLEIIEQLATLRHELEQAPPRMIVLHVSLEMLGKIVDPL